MEVGRQLDLMADIIESHQARLLKLEKALADLKKALEDGATARELQDLLMDE